MIVTREDLRDLAIGKIITARGFSGKATDIETAMAAPTLVVIEALSGKTYDLSESNGQYELTERKP